MLVMIEPKVTMGVILTLLRRNVRNGIRLKTAGVVGDCRMTGGPDGGHTQGAVLRQERLDHGPGHGSEEDGRSTTKAACWR